MMIVILDGYTANPGDLSWGALEEMGQLTVYDRTRPEETIERAKDADIVLTNKVCLRRAEIEQLPKLKYIGVLATGYNVVDNWDTELTELAGKTFGIVGLGNIGRRVAAIAQAFGMRVAAYTSKRAEDLPSGIAKLTIDELLQSADVVSLHCPLTPDTRHLINSHTLQLMKPSAVLINTGRGPLVNDQDVAEALKANRLRAYCADVLSDEPPKADNPLLSCPNAFITPHIAWATKEARTRLVSIAIGNVQAFLSARPINVV